MTSILEAGTIPPAERLSFRSDTILRIKRPGLDSLYACPTPSVGKSLTHTALEYRRTTMSYDYMEHPDTDYDDPVGAWTSMLAYKPELRPLCFLFQRGSGKQPKVSECYAIGPTVYRRAIGQRLLALAESKHSTLRPHYFDKAMTGYNPREDVVGWLDMRNPIAWFTDISMWRAAGVFLGIDVDFPYRFAEPKWEETFIISKPTSTTVLVPNETSDLPACPVLCGMCDPDAPTGN